MLTGLLKASGILILRFVYGKYYDPEKQSLGKALLLSAINCFWIMTALFLITASTWYILLAYLLFLIGYPTVLIVWRYKVKKSHEQEGSESNEEKEGD
ncbi:MAG: hypothetical protein IK108_02325 [Clostridia bacterium]|nr:hypothetical protein [Clostridia bacterium]